MVSYTTDLKTWGASGVEYPDGYSYVEGEQPVDGWDNYVISNIIDDIQHLVDVTNNTLATESYVDTEITNLDGDGDGKVDEAEYADSAGSASSATTASLYKNNDIDSDGDGNVDKADDADTLQGNSPADLTSNYVSHTIPQSNSYTTPESNEYFSSGEGTTHRESVSAPNYPMPMTGVGQINTSEDLESNYDAGGTAWDTIEIGAVDRNGNDIILWTGHSYEKNISNISIPINFVDRFYAVFEARSNSPDGYVFTVSYSNPEYKTLAPE